MILPILVLASSMLGQAVQSFKCSNLLDQRTELLSNADGLRIALRVHAEDDHRKESHLCQTDYFVIVTRPDGTSAERQLQSIDDSWGRSGKFWIDGFARQSRQVLATIMEQGPHPTFQIVVYSLPTDKFEIFEVPRSLIEEIPRSCRDSFSAVGITRLGDPVVGFRGGGCQGSTARWDLRQGPFINGVQGPSRPIRLSDDSDIELISMRENASAQ